MKRTDRSIWIQIYTISCQKCGFIDLYFDYLLSNCFWCNLISIGQSAISSHICIGQSFCVFCISEKCRELSCLAHLVFLEIKGIIDSEFPTDIFHRFLTISIRSKSHRNRSFSGSKFLGNLRSDTIHTSCFYIDEKTSFCRFVWEKCSKFRFNTRICLCRSNISEKVLILSNSDIWSDIESHLCSIETLFQKLSDIYGSIEFSFNSLSSL